MGCFTIAVNDEDGTHAVEDDEITIRDAKTGTVYAKGTYNTYGWVNEKQGWEPEGANDIDVFSLVILLREGADPFSVDAEGWSRARSRFFDDYYGNIGLVESVDGLLEYEGFTGTNSNCSDEGCCQSIFSWHNE